VPPENAGAYRIVTITQPGTAADTAIGSAQIAALYAEAQSAIDSGDLKTAEKKLAAVLAISPTYRKAKAQHDAIAAGKKVTSDKSSNPTTTKPTKPSTPSTQPTTSAGSLQSWIPDTLPGYSALKAAIDPLSVSREYKPGSGNPVGSLVIYAEQFRSSTDAKNALKVDVKERYPHSAGSGTVHGHTVYFGTNGRFATMAFTSGPVMVALEASPDSGGPAAMKSALEKAVGQLP